MTVNAPPDPSPTRALEALIEEARKRARRRRLKYAASVAVLLLGSGVFLTFDRDPARMSDGGSNPSAAPPPSERLALARKPYMGVSCAQPNSTACDRVGLAVWLRQPATRLTARIAGNEVAMAASRSAPCRTAPQKCDTYFEGFLQPAGLLEGPLRVRPDRGRYHWTGSPPVVATVQIIARDSEGRTNGVTLQIPLRAGWG